MRTGRRIVAPDLVNEVVRRYNLADVKDEDRKDRPLKTAADLDWAAWSGDFERAQDLELHSRNRRMRHPWPDVLPVERALTGVDGQSSTLQLATTVGASGARSFQIWRCVRGADGRGRPRSHGSERGRGLPPTQALGRRRWTLRGP